MKLSKLRASCATRKVGGQVVHRQGHHSISKLVHKVHRAFGGSVGGGNAAPRLDRPGRKHGGKIHRADGGVPNPAEPKKDAAPPSAPTGIMQGVHKHGGKVHHRASGGKIAMVPQSNSPGADENKGHREMQSAGDMARVKRGMPKVDGEMRARGGRAEHKHKDKDSDGDADDEDGWSKSPRKMPVTLGGFGNPPFAKGGKVDEAQSSGYGVAGTKALADAAGTQGKKDGGGTNWVKGAIKRPGALHRALRVPEGQKIPAKKLAKAAHSDNPHMRKMVGLAKTLGKMHKG